MPIYDKDNKLIKKARKFSVVYAVAVLLTAYLLTAGVLFTVDKLSDVITTQMIGREVQSRGF